MSSSKPPPHNDTRAETGIAGLDTILCGGLPCHRLYLIQGNPGTGKTTLAMQFLLQGARQGETTLYVTLSETREEIELVAGSHGWDLADVQIFDLSAVGDALNAETDNTFFHPSEVELTRVTEALLAEINRVEPTRVVFDSLSELRLMSETALRYRRQILSLKQYLAGRKITVLMLDDNTGSDDQHVESIAHGVITLQRSSPEYGVSQRQLVVEKLRGSKFREGRHDLVLDRGGMTVFPRLTAVEHGGDFHGETIPSGISKLDALLGGGLDRGTSTIFMGPPGTGKSTLAARFCLSVIERGEKALFILFDETPGLLLARTSGLGINLRPHVESGRISLLQVDPAVISPGELAERIRCAVTEQGVRAVCIDSINGYLNSMPEMRFLNLQLHELFTYLARQGVLTLLVLAQQGLVGAMQSTVDLTYLSDTVVLSRFFEARGEVRLALSVIKKRSGDHERTIREYRFTRQGIVVGEPLHEMQGVLTGVPAFVTGADSLLPPTGN